MIRTLKALGLMAVAALALSAMVATAAQAEVGEEGIFTSGLTGVKHTRTTLDGKQIGTEAENFFSITAGERVVTCTNEGVTYMSDIESESGEAKTLTVKPEYKKCTAEGLPVKVTVHNCDYTFTAPKTNEKNVFTGKAHLFCPKGEDIEVHIYLGGKLHEEAGYNTELCNVKVTPKEGEEQELGGHIIYTNDKEGSEPTPGVKRDEVTATATIEGIHYHEEGLCGAHTGDDGTFHSKVTITGTLTTVVEGKEVIDHHDVWVSDKTNP